MSSLFCNLEYRTNRALLLEDFAHQLESMPQTERFEVWSHLPLDDRAATLAYCHSEPRKTLIQQCDDTDLFDLGLHLSGGELADIFEELPEFTLQQIVDHLDLTRRSQYQALAQYQADQLGRHLSQELITVPRNASLSRTKTLLLKKHFPYIQHVYRIDRESRFLGAVRLVNVLAAQDGTLASLDDSSVQALAATLPIQEAIGILEASGWAALPVVDAQGCLIGVFTMGTAMMAQREKTQSLVLSTGGIDEQDDLFSPLKEVVKDRGLWLGINLATAILASTFIAMFESSLSELVALAVLMPLVASMGGITGSQTLSTVIRRMALSQINQDNQHLILRREVAVGLVNGAVWSIVGSVLAFVWFGDARVAVALAVGLSVNISVAAWSGMVIPLLLKRKGIDPAISGAVILTTVTDIVGFVSFLGSATAILAFWPNT